MRKTSLVTVQGKKMMSYAELIVLSDSQHKKLVVYAMGERLDGLEEFRESIDNLAKDLHINWSIESNGNINTICIERTTADTIDDAKRHDLEIAAANFMSAIDKLELPEEKKETECPTHEDAVQVDESERQERVDFIKLLLHDMNKPKDDEDHIIGAQIMCVGPAYIPFPVPWGQLSYDLFKEMCELYLEANHETEK